MRLLIVNHITHYLYRGQLWAYGPYAREIEIWCDLFPAVRVAAPCVETPPPGDCLPVERANITISRKLRPGGVGVSGRVPYLWKLPVLVGQLLWDFAQTEAVHVRCPCPLGLVAALIAPLFYRYRYAKYAGQWTSYPGEPVAVRLQRAVLASRWWSAPVTVYGEWPNQPRHVIPFFTSIMSDAQIEHARQACGSKSLTKPIKVLYTGRLSKSKNVDILLRAVAQALAKGADLTCTVVGGGPELDNLRRQSRVLGIDNRTTFTGAIGHEDVLRQLETSHVLALVSETEGWPKALTEGMVYGLVCIGSNRGLVPQLLGDGRGLVVPPGDVDLLCEHLSAIAGNPEDYISLGLAAAEWSQRFSLERVRDELRSLLESAWRCRLPSSSSGATLNTRKHASSGAECV